MMGANDAANCPSVQQQPDQHRARRDLVDQRHGAVVPTQSDDGPVHEPCCKEIQVEKARPGCRRTVAKDLNDERG